MHVPEWLVTPFDMKIYHKCDFEEELNEFLVNLEAKALLKSKNLSEYYGSMKTTSKYPKLRASAEPFILAFQTSFMVEADISHVSTILRKQRNSRQLQKHDELRLKLPNFHSNINNLSAAHQSLSSHQCQLLY